MKTDIERQCHHGREEAQGGGRTRYIAETAAALPFKLPANQVLSIPFVVVC